MAGQGILAKANKANRPWGVQVFIDKDRAMELRNKLAMILERGIIGR